MPSLILVRPVVLENKKRAYARTHVQTESCIYIFNLGNIKCFNDILLLRDMILPYTDVLLSYNLSKLP